ncbi:MAG: hypothetical protein IPP83_01295 [Flavobacteriales bacterium]|nr:hypothetical protein [Flavobacteriales bacterium]
MPQKIDIEVSKNEDFNKHRLSDLLNGSRKIHFGGGEKWIGMFQPLCWIAHAPLS